MWLNFVQLRFINILFPYSDKNLKYISDLDKSKGFVLLTNDREQAFSPVPEVINFQKNVQCHIEI